MADKGECSLFKQMELPPPHVLAQLDALIVGQSIAAPSVVVEDDDDRSISSGAFGIESSATSFLAPRHVDVQCVPRRGPGHVLQSR